MIGYVFSLAVASGQKSGDPSRYTTDNNSGKSSIRLVALVSSVFVAPANQKFRISINFQRMKSYDSQPLFCFLQVSTT